MPMCAYATKQNKRDETFVENVFLRDYMPAASGSDIKVYLYGLMQCQSGVGNPRWRPLRAHCIYPKRK
ncbi:hypothetical protein LJC55_03345 [Eubacteriales bacterium OttesenSCG-928-N14]|nr:hypothetical protein [Eubacteriales bacterium OttesenSCG-928-N14]